MAYGLEVTGPDGTTVVWSSELRATNIQTISTYNLAAGASVVVSCADANQSGVLITLKTSYPNVIITNRTSTSFTVENNSGVTRSGTVIAMRVS